jgi:hypothetical protein
MREEQNLTSIIKDSHMSLDEIKTAQRISGDSWVMYRNLLEGAVQRTLTSGQFFHYTVDFVPSGLAIGPAYLNADTGRTGGGYGIRFAPIELNKWGMSINFRVGDPNIVDLDLIVESTQRGTIIVTES